MYGLRRRDGSAEVMTENWLECESRVWMWVRAGYKLWSSVLLLREPVASHRMKRAAQVSLLGRRTRDQFSSPWSIGYLFHSGYILSLRVLRHARGDIQPQHEQHVDDSWQFSDYVGSLPPQTIHAAHVMPLIIMVCLYIHHSHPN